MKEVSKVLFIIKNEVLETAGGVERVTNVIINQLSLMGIKVHIVYTGIKKITSEEVHKNINVAYLPNPKSVNSVQNVAFLREYLDLNNVDIIINQGASDAVNTILSLIKTERVRIISTIHTSPHSPQTNFENQLEALRGRGIIAATKLSLKKIFSGFYQKKYFEEYLRQLKALYAASDKIIVLSDGFIEPFLNIIQPEDRLKIKAINNPAPFQNQLVDSLVSEKENIILSVSRLEYSSKRLDHLLEIWGAIESRHQDWRLILVGGPSENDTEGPEISELKRLKKIVRKKRLERVTFAGRQDPKQYYQISKIFAMTSSNEGWGMTLVEAQQFACVPIAFDSFTSLNEIIHHGHNGFIVPYADISCFATLMDDLISHPDVLNKMAEASRDYVNKFSAEKIGGDWLSLFEAELM